MARLQNGGLGPLFSTLWLFNIAMEAMAHLVRWFTYEKWVDCFSMAMLNNQMVHGNHWVNPVMTAIRISQIQCRLMVTLGTRHHFVSNSHGFHFSEDDPQMNHPVCIDRPGSVDVRSIHKLFCVACCGQPANCWMVPQNQSQTKKGWIGGDPTVSGWWISATQPDTSPRPAELCPCWQVPVVFALNKIDLPESRS